MCRSRRPRINTFGVAAVFALALASAGHAQVLAIGDDGAVTIYDHPAVFDGDSVRLLSTNVPISSNARPNRAPSVSRGRANRGGADLAPAFDRAGTATALSPLLLAAVARQESHYQSDAVSPKNARGVMQLMPGTARDLGVDARDPDQNINGGARYLRTLLDGFHGDLELALAAYNAGPAAVHRYGGVPPYAETRAYIDGVMRNLSLMAIAANRSQ
jgi:soluble lytic murein transglycosylase-like protein